ncbi:MAG TPA: BamA/TamA family outer membrane protein [Bacteroidia bacterium]|nr:BamA/TamA family outer membrane protein [Bacteroidia bacterium]
MQVTRYNNSIITLLLLVVALPLYGSDTTRRKKSPVSVFPVPAFGYAPETRWYVGAVALFNLRFLQKDSFSRVSSAKAEINYTQNKQLIAEVQWSAFSKTGSWYHEGLLGYRKFPELYWGVGANTPDSVKELYSAKRIEADIRSLKLVGANSFLGLRFRLQNMFDVEFKNGGLMETSRVVGSQGAVSAGVGPAFLYDSRKNALNAQQGVFFSTSFLHFGKSFGSSVQFNRFEADARKYYKLNTTVLALQAYTVLNMGGAPPFRMMGLMGSDREMRGYYQGRYRDQNYFSLQAEWRVPVKWGLGFAVFGGAGEVFEWGSPYAVKVFKYTAGGGLRIRVDKKDNINMRFDYAVGYKTSGFYVAFAEAF